MCFYVYRRNGKGQKKATWQHTSERKKRWRGETEIREMSGNRRGGKRGRVCNFKRDEREEMDREQEGVCLCAREKTRQRGGYQLGSDCHSTT